MIAGEGQIECLRVKRAAEVAEIQSMQKIQLHMDVNFERFRLVTWGFRRAMYCMDA